MKLIEIIVDSNDVVSCQWLEIIQGDVAWWETALAAWRENLGERWRVGGNEPCEG